jgi:Mg-chelatase subunit ChlI
VDEWQTAEKKLSKEIEAAREHLPQVKHSHADIYAIAELTSGLEVDGHRADLVILKAARAHAAFAGRTHIDEHDILLAAELALPHRLKRKPFQDVEVRFEQLEKQLERAREGVQSEGQPKGDQKQDVKKKRP